MTGGIIRKDNKLDSSSSRFSYNSSCRFLCGAFGFGNDSNYYLSCVNDNNNKKVRFFDALEYHEDDGIDVIDVGRSPHSMARTKKLAFGSESYFSPMTGDYYKTSKKEKFYILEEEEPLMMTSSSLSSLSESFSFTEVVVVSLKEEEPSKKEEQQQSPLPPPLKELPLRFLRAGKGDPVEGQRRYEQTLAWRKEYSMDTILHEPQPNFEVIKANYPQYFHLRSKDNEPVWYEKPAKVNLKVLKKAGVTLDKLLQHYAMTTEFGWQYLERDDLARSVTVIDLEGMRFTDFAGDVVDFVRRASAFSGQHYPERAGHVFVINVPTWFKMIWSVVKGFVDEVTLQKISILRGDEQQIKALQEKIDIKNIPPEYGGLSMPLGQSPEEEILRKFMKYNNNIKTSDGCYKEENSEFSSWAYARSY